MTFRPVRRTRLAEQVASAIRDAIFGGSYRVGDALPAERDLADQFGVNRLSVREALHRLEALGLVEVRHGGGTRVADVLAGASLHLLPWLLAPGGRLDPAMLRDLLELRVALLGFTARLAAQRAEDLEPLRSALSRLQEARGTQEVAQREFEFFDAMVQASGNRVLLLLANGVTQVWQQNQSLFEPLFPETMDTTLHESVLAAVEARDPVTARAAYEAHGLAMMAGS